MQPYLFPYKRYHILCSKKQPEVKKCADEEAKDNLFMALRIAEKMSRSLPSYILVSYSPADMGLMSYRDYKKWLSEAFENLSSQDNFFSFNS